MAALDSAQATRDRYLAFPTAGGWLIDDRLAASMSGDGDGDVTAATLNVAWKGLDDSGYLVYRIRLRSVGERRRFVYAVRIPAAAAAALLVWPEHAPLVDERDERRLAAAAESRKVRGRDDCRQKAARLGFFGRGRRRRCRRRRRATSCLGGDLDPDRDFEFNLDPLDSTIDFETQDSWYYSASSTILDSAIATWSLGHVQRYGEYDSEVNYNTIVT